MEENELMNDIDDFQQQDLQDTIQNPENPENPENQETDSFIASILKDRGIQDMSKIKFEEDGEVKEVNWKDLSVEDQLNIFNSSSTQPKEELDEEEIALINAIRTNRMSPSEYIQYLQQEGINSYLQNNQEVPQYQVDSMTDEELFLYDFISRIDGATEDEAKEALTQAKSNEQLFTKQMGALRAYYQQAEDNQIQQEQLEEQYRQQEEFENLSNQVVDQINALEEIKGYDLNLEDSDKQELYEFILGQDAAGNNYFAKALADPKTLVRVAWLALNGEQMLEDVTTYFQNEIKSVREQSYKKGKEDALKTIDNPQSVYKPKSEKDQTYYDDLD